MPIVHLIVRATLAAAFLIAAAGKVRDRAGAVEAASAFGVPPRLAPLVGRALPLVEAACAVLLLVSPLARVGAIAAAAVLAAFTVAVLRSLRRGERPVCHCFGSVSDEPIGSSTVVRNVVMLTGALVLALGGHDAEASVSSVIDGRDAGSVANVLGVVLFALALGAVLLLVELRQVLARVDALEASVSPQYGIAPGRTAPSFTLPDLDGTAWSLQSLISEQPALLVFMDAKCTPCGELLPDLADWSYAYGDVFRVVVVTGGRREANLPKQTVHGLQCVLLQRNDEIARLYRYYGTPSAILVGTDGLVATPMSSGTDGVRSLVAALVAQAGGVRLPVGITAPPFRAMATTGEQVDNSALRGAMTVALFWDEGCAYCIALDSDLRDRLARLEQSGVTLLVASASGGTGWPLMPGVVVVGDTDRRLANAFGSPGTPSAILIDADGHIASAMAVGGEDVLTTLERALKMGKLAASFAVRPV